MKIRHGQSAGFNLRLLALVVALICLIPISSAHAAANAQEAAQIALKKSGTAGKVLGVRTEVDNNGETVFAVKVLSNGRVRVVRITQTK